MPAASLPADEFARLEKLRAYDILDTPPEEVFDRITRIAARIFATPISLISLIDGERQWFKSRVGLDVSETPRDLAFCAHAILGNEPLLVEDAIKDPRFFDNALVTADPRIRFYAGAPLITHDGYNLGTICVIDRSPRRFTPAEAAMLTELARIAVDELELRRIARGALEENAALTSAKASKDEFIALVSHELRTPLTSIAGALKLLEAGVGGPLPQAAQDMVVIACRNTDNLRRLVNDLLDFQQHVLGAMTFEFAPVDLAVLVHETVGNMAGYAAAAHVEIVVDEPDGIAQAGVPPVLADRMRLQQVLLNLLSNAVKYSPTGETVRISLDTGNGTAAVSVTDRGPGIPPEFQDRVFRMFAKASGSGKPAGAGIGLALSKAIIEAHGGTIGYDTAPDSGTSFEVALPLQEALAGTLSERAIA